MSKKNSMLLLVLACAFTLCTLGLTSTTHGADYYVKTPANGGSDSNDGQSWDTARATITSAIGLATGTDTIHVAAGTYTENISFVSNLTLWGGYPAAGGDPASRDRDTYPTIIDGGASGSVVIFDGVSNCTIDGFTITHGTGTPEGIFVAAGGGIFCIESSPVISNNKIIENNVGDLNWQYGGGIFCYNNSDSPHPQIIDNIIQDNDAYLGGGIYVEDSSPEISGNTIMGNTVVQGGGGIYLKRETSATIDNNTINNNTASNAGGGISINSGNPTITNNSIFNNTADSTGGGIAMQGGSAEIVGNKIFGNNNTTNGGGIGLSASSKDIDNVAIRSNSIINNEAEFGAGIFIYCRTLDYTINSVIENNLIAANLGPNNLGGIRMQRSSPKIINNTIAYNTDHAINVGGDSFPDIVNNILWGNGGDLHLATEDMVHYCDIEDGSFSGTNGNISSDPAFSVESGSTSTGLTATTLTDSTQSWAVDSLKGLVLNPNTNQTDPPRAFVIISNSATTITTLPLPFMSMTDEGIAVTGDPYAIIDFHIQDSSPCIDAGTSGFSAPALDYDGDSRDANPDIGYDEFVFVGCTNDSQCTEPEKPYCDESTGICQACTENSECGTCEYCNKSGDDFVCANQPEGEDYKEECPAEECKTGTCDGSGACGNSPDWITACTPDSIDCTHDLCFNGECVHPDKNSGEACGDPTVTDCDGADTCDGAGVCQDNLAPNGESCTPDSIDCTYDVCSNGACIHPNKAAGEPCDDDGSGCTDDICGDEDGICTHPLLGTGIECRGAAGDCDVAEICNGVSPDCPADSYLTAGTECRGTAGDCDVAETCPGDSPYCPDDGYLTAGTECRGTAGDCDVAETCPGNSPYCPADAKSTAECRASLGVCDPAEFCNGIDNDCPPVDAKSTAECRASLGVCDPAEFCNGIDDDCPADAYEPNDTPCDDGLYCTQIDVCQGGICIGSGDPCENDAGYCDGVEFCEEGGDPGPYTCSYTGDPCDTLICESDDTCVGSDVALIIGDSSANPGTVDIILDILANDIEVSDVTVNVCDIDHRDWLHIYTDTCTLTPRVPAGSTCVLLDAGDDCVEVSIAASSPIDDGSGAIVQLSYTLDTDAPVGEIADIKPDIISMFDESTPITATTPVPGTITVPDIITTTSSTTTTTAPIITTTTVPPVSTTTTGPGPECSFDSDCNDGNDCTIDECIAGICSNTPVADGTECGEELFCTLDASCVAGECVGTARDCDDGEFCTGVESCDEASDECVSPGDPCTAPEVCDEDEDVCKEAPLPCDISIEPSSAAVASGETLSFTVTQEGDCDGSDYEWKVESTIGSSVDQDGNYTAGRTLFQAASDVVMVSVVDHGNGDITAAATITVSPKCSLVKIYGEHSKEVKILRLFRDSVLSQTPEGQEIIRLYYAWSPVIAQAIDDDEEFKEEVKETVDRVLRLIRETAE